jgi:Tol biopolymer transport system component
MKVSASSLRNGVCIVCLILSAAIVVSAQSAPVRKIAFTYGGGAFSSSIAVINEDGSGQIQLTNGGFIDQFPSWSPDGSEIVFQSNRFGGNLNILRMKADGTGIVPLTDFASSATSVDPAWSPDGTKILFVSDRAGGARGEIWVMNADGTNPLRLTTNSQSPSGSYFHDFEPAWSPDGTKIVFRSERDGFANSEIYSMNADGSNQTRLTNNAAEDKEPSWSPNGQRIAFFSRGGGRDGIYVMDANGGNEQHIAGTGFQPTWSPDGLKIAFTDFDPQANFVFAIYLINADGSNRTKITNNPNLDSWTPAWQTLGGPPPPPPPGPIVYSVSGIVYDSSIPNGPGVAGITMTVTGTTTATTTTDANGRFLIGNLPEGGSFNITPSSPSWSFFPTSKSFNTSYPFIGFVGKNINVEFYASPITLEFSSASYSAQEGSGFVVTVQRNGSITGASTIDYSVSDGTAVAGTDYAPTAGTLHFNPGESQKSFSIPIIYDKKPEPSETINLALTNPTGSVARGRQTAVLTISDPAPVVIAFDNGTGAAALNAETWVRDPFHLTTSSFLGQSSPTRVALFAGFVDLVPGEEFSAVKVEGFHNQQGIFPLPVEFVGPVPGQDGITQINVRLTANLPTGDFFVFITLRGLTSTNSQRIRIQ